MMREISKSKRIRTQLRGSKWLTNGCYPSYPSSPVYIDYDSRKIHAKMSKDGDPRAYAPRARQTPATVRGNAKYFSIFWKVAKTYHKAQLIGRMFSPHQPAV